LYILSTTTKTGANICNEFKSLNTGTSTQICEVQTINYTIDKAQRLASSQNLSNLITQNPHLQIFNVGIIVANFFDCVKESLTAMHFNNILACCVSLYG